VVHLLHAAPGDRRTRCLFTAYDGEVTRLYRLTPAHRLVRCPVRLAGYAHGVVWLGGRRLAMTRATDRASSAVVVDTSSGEVSPLLDVGAGTEDRAELYSPRSGLLVVRTDAGGAERVGFARAGEEFWFPDETAAEGGITPLALDPAGHQVLLHEQQGAHSRLAVYDTGRRTRVPLATPPGCLRGPAVWTRSGIDVPWSAPDVPHTMLRLRPGTPAPRLTPVPGARPARVVTVEGAAGPLEAIAYGGPGWRRAPHLVVALHGGPLSAWHFEYDPLLAALAGAGIGVLALNQRGSTGYGPGHVRHVHGGWGGPDLDDVTTVVRSLAAGRGDLGGPAVLGQSYGAYLALLAACAVPEQVSACVAIAPFRSAAHLYAHGAGAVRRLIDRLDGRREITDGLGPRDVARLAGRVSARTLLVHGDRDEVVPVEESRELHARFVALRRAKVTYLEVAGEGHDLFSGAAAESVLAAVRGVLITGGGEPGCR
jgi:pimeloyl-ACP methyl ester carboxylesterase